MKLIVFLVLNYAVSSVLALPTIVKRPSTTTTTTGGEDKFIPIKTILSGILTDLLQTKSNLRVGGKNWDWDWLRYDDSPDRERVFSEDVVVDNTLYLIKKTSDDLNRFTAGNMRRPYFVFRKFPVKDSEPENRG